MHLTTNRPRENVSHYGRVSRLYLGRDKVQVVTRCGGGISGGGRAPRSEMRREAKGRPPSWTLACCLTEAGSRWRRLEITPARLCNRRLPARQCAFFTGNLKGRAHLRGGLIKCATERERELALAASTTLPAVCQQASCSQRALLEQLALF